MEELGLALIDDRHGHHLPLGNQCSRKDGDHHERQQHHPQQEALVQEGADAVGGDE